MWFKTVEIGTMLFAIGSIIWLVVTMAGLDTPRGDPRLLRAIMIAGFAVTVWAITLTVKEIKEFGWLHALVSLVTLLLVQLLIFWLFR